MGSVISRARFLYRTIREILGQYEELDRKINSTPGLPRQNPTTPYWAVPPAPLADWGSGESETVVEYADVVILGSGITGASIARALLDGWNAEGSEKGSQGLKVVMLEARSACSGATARNGGHITPDLYRDIDQLQEMYGIDTAKRIIQFRLAHCEELISVATEESILEDSQARPVDTFDVYQNTDNFSTAKAKLERYLAKFPEHRSIWDVYESPEDIRALQLSNEALGAIGTKAGAIHPYRFVTGILHRLLKSYKKSFHLYTHTPCTAVIRNSPTLFTVVTPRGSIRTRHVVHATNAWSSHLLPGMRRKIVPVRAQMSAQRPGLGLGHPSPSKSKLSDDSSWLGKRSLVFYPGESDTRFDYLTQQPVHSDPATRNLQKPTYPSPHGELMFGGGFASVGEALFQELGNLDDTTVSSAVGTHLSGSLAQYFGEHWGEEGRPSEDEVGGWNRGRVMNMWTGIIGISADSNPWVGRVPDEVSGRPIHGLRRDDKVSEADYTPVLSSLAPPGEWISAGYTGEGMVNAWLSGKALALEILNGSTGNAGRSTTAAPEWLPGPFRMSVRRWKKARIEDFLDEF